MTGKRVVVFSAGQSEGGSDWPPDGATGFVAWFQGKIDGIPEEYRAGALVMLRGESSYDGNEVEIEITYRRPYTEEEMEQARQAKLAMWSRTRDAELATLARLRAKYDNGPMLAKGGKR